MDNSHMQHIIEDYINAYNHFDVEGMVRHVHPDIEFRNISDGEVTHAIKGVEGFKLQAQEATRYFSEREQQVTGMTITDDHAEVLIHYTGTLAVDLPNGLQAGQRLELQGKSLFSFEAGKIIRIEDVS